MSQTIIFVFFTIVMLVSSIAIVMKWSGIGLMQVKSAFPMLFVICYALLLQVLVLPVYARKEKMQYMLLIVICVMLLLWSLLCYFEKIKLPADWEKAVEQKGKGVQALLLLFPIVIITLEILFYFTMPNTSKVVEWLLLWFFVITILGLVSTYYIVYYMAQQNELMLLIKYQEESRDYMKLIRSQRHDFNFHLHAVSGLMESGEYEKCLQYVRDMVKDADEVNELMPLQDAAIGSMLYDFKRKARALGFDITYDIGYDMSHILCTAFECNKIIGNLIQNSIDEVSRLKDKAYGIRVTVFKRRGNTVIICENEFEGTPEDIVRSLEYGYTTKKQHEGIGLGMVALILKKYGGRIYTEFHENVVRFIVNIPNAVGGEE